MMCLLNTKPDVPSVVNELQEIIVVLSSAANASAGSGRHLLGDGTLLIKN